MFFDTYALVDSGADCCIFQIDQGEYIGLDVKSVNPTEMRGISNKKVLVYLHEVRMILRSNEFKIKCGFVDKNELPTPLLGRHGFFDRYSITFFEKNKYLEITPGI